MKRIPMIAGNWKMHMTLNQAKELVQSIHYGCRFPKNVDVVVAPPFTALSFVAECTKDSYISVSAQNLYPEDKGAFTGEISSVFIKDVGADYVIIGHSERRQYFLESNEFINKKVKAAFKHALIPIVCVGETLAEREKGLLNSVLATQIFDGLQGLTEAEAKLLVVAYEPVWAIGTGKTASPDQAEEAHRIIRGLLKDIFGELISEKIRILYGGSVKADNAKELMQKPNIDGALVGGASLKAEDFITIIKASEN